MKNLCYLLIIMLTGFSCTKSFNRTNINPNQFENATPEAIIAGSIKRTSDLLANANMDYHWTSSHLLCIGGGSSRYGVGGDGFWEQSYVEILGNLNQLDKKYSTAEGFNNKVQIGRIWQAYVYSILVGTYGPIPMQNALKPEAGSSILFDDEDVVYTTILTMLKEAGDKIDITEDKLSYDVLYTGDLLKWKKFANTLRLKIALRCQKNLGTVARTHITEVMQAEATTISAETETAKMAYENIDGNQSPYYIRYVRNSFTQDIAPKMSDYIFTWFRSYNDPRLSAYYDSVPAINRYLLQDTLTSTLDDSLRIVTYRIPYFGYPKAPRLLPGWGLTSDPVGGLNILTYSDPKKTFIFTAEKPFIHLSYAEAMFMKAEAAKLGLGGAQTAEQYYNAGIDANFANWGITGAAATNYKNQNGVKFGTSATGYYNYLGLVNTNIPEDDLFKIWLQQWINYYPDGGFDTWCLERRTRVLELPPHTNPANQFINATFSLLPNRWVYPTTVLNYNTPGYNDAVAKLGGDERSPYVNLSFLQPLPNKDWNTQTAVLNFGFVQHWYGTTIQSLQNNGIAYTLIRTYK